MTPKLAHRIFSMPLSWACVVVPLMCLAKRVFMFPTAGASTRRAQGLDAMDCQRNAGLGWSLQPMPLHEIDAVSDVV